MYYKFTAKAEKALEIAQEIAMNLGHNYIGTEHILLALIKEGENVAVRLISTLNVPVRMI